MSEVVLLQKMQTVRDEDGIGSYEPTSEYASATIEEDGAEATFKDGSVLLYSGSWEDAKGADFDLYENEDHTVTYIDVTRTLSKDVTVRWSFNTGQQAALTHLMFRAAVDNRLSDEMKNHLYDWHLCRNLDLNLELAIVLLNQTDDMSCDYVGITERIQDCDDPDRYNTDHGLNESYSDLQAVTLILEKAIDQIEEKIEEMKARF